jgi:hypothetical protein
MNQFKPKWIRKKICPICLEKMTWRQKIKKLICNHEYHAKCIKMIYKLQCPLCETPIFSQYEEKILKCKNSHKLIKLLQHQSSEAKNIENLFFFLLSQKNKTQRFNLFNWKNEHYLKILNLLYKYCDFTDILANNLNNEFLVNDLIEKNNINWYKTFNGKTLFELVVEKSDNLFIINSILNKLPQNPLPSAPIL